MENNISAKLEVFTVDTDRETVTTWMATEIRYLKNGRVDILTSLLERSFYELFLHEGNRETFQSTEFRCGCTTAGRRLEIREGGKILSKDLQDAEFSVPINGDATFLLEQGDNLFLLTASLDAIGHIKVKSLTEWINDHIKDGGIVFGEAVRIKLEK